MNTQELEIYNRPYALSHELSGFYAKSVGFALNYNKETVLLLDWQESINACEKLSRNLRDRYTMRDMAAFKAEVLVLLECNASK